MTKFKKHIPLHFYIDQSIYFITSRTINGKRLFNRDEKKNILLKRFNIIKNKFNLTVHA
ncbi:MAG: hypothetical protein V1838_00295 [Patescibacteria group bacterium]